MLISDIRAKYLAFYKERGHAVIPSFPLVPKNDSSTLFVSSGMQPLMPYFLGNTHPAGVRLVDAQKCFRAVDIEEVGDNRHTTFFEMLGNWSFGDYFKKEQLSWLFEFLTNPKEGIGLDPERLYITVFGGDDAHTIPKDTESAAIWKKLFADKNIKAKEVFLGSEEEGYHNGMQGGHIFYYNVKKNWWSRAGEPEHMPVGEPGGPDAEVFYDFGTPHDSRFGAQCHPNCDCGRFVEICNSVFMQYIKKEDGSFVSLSKHNVDFGGGLERLAAASNHNPDVFSIDVLSAIIHELQSLSGVSYEDESHRKSFRIVADHMRAAVFMLADGVIPSNTEAGYIARRLIRRAVQHADRLGIIAPGSLTPIVAVIAKEYYQWYPELSSERMDAIAQLIGREEERFRSTLAEGMRQLDVCIKKREVTGHDAFILFTTYGFPFELTKEIAEEHGITVDTEAFKNAMREHQERSRVGAEQRFKEGLGDTKDKSST